MGFATSCLQTVDRHTAFKKWDLRSKTADGFTLTSLQQNEHANQELVQTEHKVSTFFCTSALKAPKSSNWVTGGQAATSCFQQTKFHVSSSHLFNKKPRPKTSLSIGAPGKEPSQVACAEAGCFLHQSGSATNLARLDEVTPGHH